MAELFIASVTDAASKIVNYYRNGLYDEMREVYKYLRNAEVATSIAGNADEFHNATVQLSRQGFYEYAYALVEVGHRRYPKNTDLLGDLLAYGMHCKDLKELVVWYDTLKVIPHRFWTWRAYQFSSDFWMEMLPYAESNEELEEYEKKIETLIANFKKNFKFLKDKSDCEKAYMMGFDFYYSRGDEDQAIAELTEGVTKLPGKCAQCALKLADYYFSSGDYENAAKYAQIAVDVKEDQSSISRGYTYYILAMSKENNLRASNGLQASLKKVYNAYYNAYMNLEAGRDHLLESVKFQVRQLEYEFGISSNIPFSDMDKERDVDLDSLMKILRGQMDDDN